MENLADPATRARIRAEVSAERSAEWENLCQLATPEGVLVGDFQRPENKRFENQSLQQIAATRGQAWVDALMDLTVEENGRLGAMYFLMSEENVELQLRQPWIKFGTDAGASDPADTHGSETHPRAYGTFPRILGQYVRERRVLPLEDAVRKMTSAVAERLSIRDRGLVREGMFADLVVFDPATVIDNATYEHSHQISSGILDVLVNGVPVVLEGKHTGAKPGKAVRGPGWRHN